MAAQSGGPGPTRAATSAVVTTVVAVMPVFLVGGLAVQISRDLGLTTAQLGLAVAVYFGATAVGSMPVGLMVERMSSAVTARVGILLAAGSMLSIGLWARTFSVLVALLAAAATANSLGQLASNALLARRVRTGRQGIAFGAKQAAIPLATLLGGASVPTVALTVGWRWVFVAGAALCLPALALVPRDTAARGQRPQRARGRLGPSLVALGLGAGLAAAAGTSVSTFVVASAVETGHPESTAGLMLTLGAAICVVTRVLIGALADRWRRGHLPLVAGLLAAGAVGITVLGQDLPAATLLGVVFGYGLGWSFPGLLTFAVVRLHPQAPATATSVIQAGVYAGNCFGPLAFGVLASQSGFNLAWSTAGTAMAVSAYLVLLGARLAHRAATRLRPAQRIERERIDRKRKVSSMPRLQGGPRRAGRIGLVQVVSVEAAVLVAATTVYAFPSLPVAATGSVAAVLLLPVVARFRGRWWYEAVGAWLLLRGQRRNRTRAAVLARSAGPLWPELAALSPHLVLRTVADRGRPLGIGEDHLGWFAAIAVASPDGLSRTGQESLRLEWITRLADPLTTISVVVRHASRTLLGQTPTPSSQSYQVLREALAVPPQRDIWIAVRIGQREAADAAAARGDLAIDRMLGGTVSRIQDALATHAIDHWLLDGTALRQALVGAYGPEPYDPRLARARRGPRESWSRWRAGRNVHICFAVTHWPAGAPPDLLAQLGDIPSAAAVCTAVTLGAIRAPGDDDGPLGARVLVRVVAAPSAVATCLRHLNATARRLRLGLIRLDGEQAAAVYATMPTAANDGWGRA